jgi:hypothetical protein
MPCRRFFEGPGRVPANPNKFILTAGLGTLNWVPFLVANALEFVRWTVFSRFYDPLKYVSTLYLYARKK